MSTALRAEAVQSALDKYRDTSFEWGRNDCLRLARTVLVGIGAKGLPRIPRYGSELTAIRRLKEQGHDTLENLLAEHCVEIPPSMALPGDLGTIKGDGALSAIVVCAGGKWLGWPAETAVFAPVGLRPEQLFRWVAP
ncbi:DUF6950 family protein [Algimonas porphyrae]|uniref:DUF6950 domain-containing protein n=1 Tax=Algimonas porphyrae TaxID=1128113 RepID=A0ABQ5V146_9PROT|nr:hypothetical protein [Algimonas porphyrae]GLQ20399.1 hypothetical protein GCM10007854_13540 [Algimonas porphyrae]